jgi:hypothetical protein
VAFGFGCCCCGLCGGGRGCGRGWGFAVEVAPEACALGCKGFVAEVEAGGRLMAAVTKLIPPSSSDSSESGKGRRDLEIWLFLGSIPVVAKVCGVL